jgi:hypothetical protein
VRRSRIKKLEIDELVVKRLRVLETINGSETT